MNKTGSDQVIARVTELIEVGQELGKTRTGLTAISNGWVVQAKFAQWHPSCLSFLRVVFGASHTFAQEFEKRCQNNDWRHYETGIGIMLAAKDELTHGFLSPVEVMIQAEVFSDFLEMAEHYLSLGHKDPAAMLAGAVLEDSLKKVATAKGITVKDTDDLSVVNGKLVDAKVYNQIVRKQLQVWINIRNSADHARFSEYNEEQVGKMIAEITSFIAANL